ITAAERKAAMAGSDMAGRYDTPLDRSSAYEMLAKRAETSAKEAEEAESSAEEAVAMVREFNAARRYSGVRVGRSTARRTRAPDTMASAMSHALIKELKGTTGRRIVRGVLGSLFKGR
ncbi:MAG: helicase HerA-like domain-containing protein, partial [Pseudomonadota bacterium]